MTLGPFADVTGYVLAGGQSSRMGQDKALLSNAGEGLLDRALNTLRAVCSGAYILSGPPNPRRDALLSRHADLLPDRAEDHRGPVAGLVAALQHCPTPYACIVAVDQPEITPSHLQALRTSALHGRAVACCFQCADGNIEPLPVLLSASLRTPLAQLWNEGERRFLFSIQAAIQAAAQHPESAQPREGGPLPALLGIPLPATRAASLPPPLTNLNTPADLESWRSAQQASNQSPLGASE